MTETAATDQGLVEQVLTAENRELRLLAAAGVLPLPPEVLIYLQVRLAGTEDSEIAKQAAGSLMALDPQTLASYLGSEADPETVEYFACQHDHPIVLQCILQRRDVSRDLLVQLAAKLTPDLQEILLLRQDAILEQTEILDALAKNPDLSTYSRRRIDEYRKHLLEPGPEQQVEAEPHEPAPEEEPATSTDEVFDEEVAAALAEAADGVEPEGPPEERTGLTEGQIRALPVPVRIKLARGASRTLRSILVRDTNQTVALTVLAQSSMSDQEVEQICNSRNVIDDVLMAIANRREWVRKYPILYSLVRNPLTPTGVAVRLLPRITVRDLRGLSRDHNVSEAVRSTARRLYQAKRH